MFYVYSNVHIHDIICYILIATTTT